MHPDPQMPACKQGASVQCRQHQVTRGARKPLGESRRLPRLLDFCDAAAGSPLTVSDVRIHELLLHLHWLSEAARDEAAGRLQGHGPEHYGQRLASRPSPRSKQTTSNSRA